MKKEKKNNKAFTLIELLGVIILLSVIAIIAIVAVNKNIKDTQDTLKQVQLNNIKDGAKNWSTDNIKSIPNGKSIYLTLAQLKQGGYVEENIKSPGNDKLCFPNDLQIEIKSNESGSYEYNVLDGNIIYISCEEDNLDSNAPRIVLAPGDEINDKNEVVDYVEVSQDTNVKYTVPAAYAYGSKGSDFEGIFTATVDNDNTYIPESDSNIIDNIELNINGVCQYTIIYKLQYNDENNDTKYVSAVRNIIIRDTTAPEITINKKEDVILYYKADDKINVVSYKFPINNIVITDNSGNENGFNYTYNISGEKEINDYFNSQAFKNISESEYSSKSWEFPIIISATDSSGNKSKKTQNIKFTMQEVKDPTITLSNSSNNVIYYSESSEESTYFDSWHTDQKFTAQVVSGCKIDKDESFYEYNGVKKTIGDISSITDLKNFSFDINLVEGEKQLKIIVKCDESYDLSNLENTEVSMEKNVKIDLTRPTMTVTQTPTPSTSTSTDKYLKSVVVNIKAEDSISQLSSSNNYQYCLSTSSSSLSGCSWKSYTNGSNFTLGTNLTGTYYLIFKRVSDNAKLSSYLPVSGNNNKISNIMNNTRIDNVVYHVLGPYKFDNTGPTVTLAITQTPTPSTSTNNYTKSLKVKITVADNASGVPSSNTESNKPYRYYLSTSSTNLTGGNWADYTNGTEFTIGSPKSGTYYLFVKKVNDNLGNVSTATGSTDTTITSASVTHHRFGPYKLDNEEPHISGTPSVANVERTYTVSFDINSSSNSNSSARSKGTDNCTVKTTSGSTNYCQCKKCSSTSGNSYIYISSIESNTGAKVYPTKYFQTSSKSISFTFKANYNLTSLTMNFGFSGYAACNQYKVSNFRVDGGSKLTLTGRKSGCSETTSGSSNVYGCIYTGYCSGGDNWKQTPNPVVATGVNGTPNKQFTVNFSDAGSGLATTSKTCTASPGKACTIDITDKVGNSKKVTCTYSKGTCS